MLDDDIGFDPEFVEELADRGADHALDAQHLFFVDRRWTPPNWTKSCGSTIPKTSMRPSVLAARRAAKRSATRASALSSTTTK